MANTLTVDGRIVRLALASGIILAVSAALVMPAQAAPYAAATPSKLVTWSTRLPDADQIDVPAYPGAVIIDSTSRICGRSDDGQLQCPAMSLPHVILLTRDPLSTVLAFYGKRLPGGWNPVSKELSEITHIWSFIGPDLRLADGNDYSEMLDIEPAGKKLDPDEIASYLPGARTWIKVTYTPGVMRKARNPAAIDYPPAKPTGDKE